MWNLKMENYKLKYKLLMVRRTKDLEDDINNFIEDKQIHSVEIHQRIGSREYSHEVYIMYKIEL